MKWLKEKTVINFFKKRGGRLSEDGLWIYLPARYQCISLNLYRQEALKEGKREPSLEIHGPRWKHRGNVHIVSYFGWPRSVKDLQTVWDEIRQTYGTLAGISWKDEYTVNWELEKEKKWNRQLYDLNRRFKTWSKK